MMYFTIFMISAVYAELQHEVIERHNRNIYAEPPTKFKALDVGTLTNPKWSCPIPIVINENIEYKESILEALQYITNNTVWSFVERTNQADYIHFQKIDGCWSYLGRTGGEQPISIDSGCDFGAIVHEISHAIGLTHEQSRSDRDSYVDILYENIIDEHENNFKKSFIKNYGDYDFESLMHYNQWAFSENGERTIVLRQEPEMNTFIGQRYMLSEPDIFHLNKLVDGEGCTTKIRNTNCDPNNYVLTGGRNINTFGIIYMIYTQIGDEKYRSLYKFEGEYLYLKKSTNIFTLFSNKEEWQISYKNRVYAHNDGALCSGKWSIYDSNNHRFSLDESTKLINQDCNYNPKDMCSRGKILIPSLLFLAIIAIVL